MLLLKNSGFSLHTLYYVTLKAELNSVVKIKAEKKVDSSKV